MTKLAGIALAAMLVVALAGCPQAVETDSGHADATVYGTVGGYVLDAAGRPVVGVPIIGNTGSTAKAIKEIVTNDKGWFEIGGFISGEHTLTIGTTAASAAVKSTTVTAHFHVPTLGELRDMAILPAVYDEDGNLVGGSSLIEPVDGNYFVNVDIWGDDEADSFLVYPLTATLTGFAMLKTDGTDPDNLAVEPGEGWYIVADFGDWNDGWPLTIAGTIDTGTGAFSIPNVPALGDLSAFSGPSIRLRIDRDAVVAGEVGDASTAVSPSAIVDGILQGSATRDLGTQYFVAAVAPKVVEFDPELAISLASFEPGTVIAPTPLVFTFSKAMNPARGTLAVKDDDGSPEEYLVSSAWTDGNTVLTATPAERFEYGETIAATFTGFESADGVPYPTTTHTFKVRDALKLLTASTWTAYGTGVNTVYFPLAGDVVLTFNAEIVEFDPYATYLQDAAGMYIPATITPAGTTLTFNPAADLKYNTAYKVFFKVKGRMFENDDIVADATGTACGFTTLPAARLATPSLALDAATKYIADATKSYWQRGKYNAGETALKVQIGYAAGADNYLWEYQFAGDAGWTSGGNVDTSTLVLSSDSSYYVGTLTLAGGATIDPSRTLTVRVRARDIAAPLTGAPDSEWSATLNFTDTQAPSALASTSTLLDGVIAGTFSNNGPGASDNFTVNINSSTDVDQYYQVTFGLAGTEPMATILTTDVIAQSGTTGLSVVFVSMGKSATGANVSCTILIKAAKGGTDPSGVYRVAIRDAAANAYDNLNPVPIADDRVLQIIVN